ncbi:MAG: hypothetical protein ACRYGP_13355 [Janthinobacterium lividum]
MSALAPFQSLPSRLVGTSRRHLARGRSLRLLLRTGLMAVAAAGLVAAALGGATGLLASRAPSDATSLSATASRWVDIRRPIALYDLSGSDFAKLPMTYLARNHEPDGAREDVLTFGRLGEATPFLQLSLLRTGVKDEASQGGGELSSTPADRQADAAPPMIALALRSEPATDRDGALADALAQLAGLRGMSATRIRPAASVDTRLGSVEAADLLLWTGGTAVPCLGFRGSADVAAVLQIGGFACGAPGRPLGRAALACALDRIDLVSAGDDAALRAFFVAAQRRGATTCLGGSSTSLTIGRRLGWLDPDGALPRLRGLFEVAVRRR